MSGQLIRVARCLLSWSLRPYEDSSCPGNSQGCSVSSRVVPSQGSCVEFAFLYVDSGSNFILLAFGALVHFRDCCPLFYVVRSCTRRLLPWSCVVCNVLSFSCHL